MSSEVELYKKIQEVMELVPEARHSYFQLKYFVIGKEVTHQAQMWQCLRELQSRKETIDAATLEIAEIEDRLELLEIRHAKESKDKLPPWNTENYQGEDLDGREWVIRCRQHTRKRTSLIRALKKLDEQRKFALQEARFFLQTFEALNAVEPLKDYDDLESQKEYWTERVAQEINLKMLLQQPLNTEIVQTALSLPEDSPIKKQVEATLNHIQVQMLQLKEEYMKGFKARALAEGIKEINGATQNNKLG